MKKIFIQLSGFDSSADVSKFLLYMRKMAALNQTIFLAHIGRNSLTNHTVIMSLGADGQFVFWAGSVGGAVKPTNN